MTNHPAPYKTLFLVCYSTVAAIVAAEAELLGNADAHNAALFHQEFVDEFERYLASNEKHPWCGTGRLDTTKVWYLAPNGNHDVRFINED